MNRCLVVAAIAMLGGCHKRSASEYFGTRVEPPGILAKVRLGMTVDELKAVVPGAAEDDGHGYLLDKPAKNIKLYAVAVDNVVVEAYADYAGSDARDVLTAAWGPPDAEPDRAEHEQLAWRNVTTGWRARLFCGRGTDETPLPPFCTIAFHPHKPLEAMFGKAIAPPGELAKLAIGMPLDAVRAATKRSLAVANATDVDYDGAVEHLDFVDNKLYEVSYALPPQALPIIAKAWGPGTKTGDKTAWYDAQSGWCAQLVTNDRGPWLQFTGYMPFDKEIDLLDAMAAAKSYDDAKKLHPELAWDDDGDKHTLMLPYNEVMHPDAFVAGRMLVGVFDSNELHFVVSMLDPAKADDIIAAFTKRWGQPKTTSENSNDKLLASTTYHWAGHAMLMRSTDGKDLGLTIGARE